MRWSIDLGRLPSHGRDIALYLRERKSTRHVPLIFAGGHPQRWIVSGSSSLTPPTPRGDAIDTSLKSAIANAPADPVVPRSGFEAYSGTRCRRSWASRKAQRSS